AGEPIAIVPTAAGKAFLRAGPRNADPGAEQVRDALASLAAAYAADGPILAQSEQVRTAIESIGRLELGAARSVRLELLYDHYSPWRKTALFYGLSLVLFGVSRLGLRRPMTMLALAAGAIGIAEHLLGLGLRVAILGRAPVSNTYESLLWMGLVG